MTKQISFKKIIYVLAVCIIASACGTSKNADGRGASTVKRTRHSTPRFIESINMTPGGEAPGSGNEANTGMLTGPSSKNTSGLYTNIESSTELQFKYAVMLNETVENLNNLSLLQFIEEWYGTRYRYGGSTRNGIDCSGFTCNLANSVYGKTLPRTSREQFERSQKIPVEYLQQGDLVFFNTSGGVSHVGVYLTNNKFVHASTSSGVVISDLNEDYYRRRFIGAGRL